MKLTFIVTALAVACATPSFAHGGVRGVAQDDAMEDRKLSDTYYIVDYGADPVDELPLDVCEGDCDSDADCDDNLYCLQRNAGYPVPGCVGSWGSNSDFCVMEKYFIEDFGGTPAEEYLPLGLCEGDCDTDDDCAEGYYCFERDMGDPIYGCAGPLGSNSDFCSVDYTPPPDTSIQDFGGTPDEDLFPLQICQGDCDHDHDCEGNLICFQRNENGPIPGCVGSSAARTDFCVMKPATPYMDFGGTPSADKFPLQLCQGDCDVDADCDVGYGCFQRGPGLSIPGCYGTPNSHSDFCVMEMYV